MTAVGLAIVVVLGNFDGWYQATLSAGDITRPQRNLPLGMIGGTTLVGVVYLLVNLVYSGLCHCQRSPPRRGSEKRRRQRYSALVLAACWRRRCWSRCSAASRRQSSARRDSACRCQRTRQPFGGCLGYIRSTRRRQPGSSLSASGRWCSSCLAATNSCFGSFPVRSIIFHVITGLALFHLRRHRPDMPRPYRVIGYPWVPALFVVAMTGLVLNTFYERPLQSLFGVGLVALGVPFFRWHRVPKVRRVRA